MTGKIFDGVPNMRQRTILQHLSLADWRMVDRLPVSAGEVTLGRLLHHGWIESRGEKQRAAVRLTPAGLEALRSPIRKPFVRVELGLKAKGKS
jgi:DNA-binding PadR family transcriptional regulator